MAARRPRRRDNYCQYFQKGGCRRQNCPFIHRIRFCAFYKAGRKDSCLKGDRCTFAHYSPEVQDAVRKLGLVEEKTTGLHPCPHCSDMCLGRQCKRCHDQWEKRRLYNRRNRSRSRSRSGTRSATPSPSREDSMPKFRSLAIMDDREEGEASDSDGDQEPMDVARPGKQE